MLAPTTKSPLFPYTTLFRSHGDANSARADAGAAQFFVTHVVVRAVGGQNDERLDAAETRRQQKQTHAIAEAPRGRSEEHTSELQSHHDLVCRLLLEKKTKRA